MAATHDELWMRQCRSDTIGHKWQVEVAMRSLAHLLLAIITLKIGLPVVFRATLVLALKEQWLFWVGHEDVGVLAEVVIK